MNHDTHHPINPPSSSKPKRFLILDKFPGKVEIILGNLLFCAILMPTGAQAVLTTLWVVLVLGRLLKVSKGQLLGALIGPGILKKAAGPVSSRRSNGATNSAMKGSEKPHSEAQLGPSVGLDSEVRVVWGMLVRGLLVFWAVHLVSLATELVDLSSDVSLAQVFTMHLRLLGKQGFYGCLIILGFLMVQAQGLTFGSRRSLINPWWILGCTALLLMYMVAQRYVGIDWIHGFSAKIGEHRYAYGVYRASGLMGHPLTLAYNAMILGLLALCHAFWLNARKDRDAKIWFCISVLLLLQIVLTGSRYPALLSLSLAAVLSIVHLRQRNTLKKNKIILGLSIVGSVAGIVLADTNLRGRFLELTQNTTNFEDNFDRLIFWKVNLKLWFDHLWAGSGLARYSSLLLDYYNQAGYNYLERKYAAHNIFIQTLADLGLLGGVGLLILCVTLGRVALRCWRTWQHMGPAAIVVATLLGGLLQNNLRDSEYLFGLWVCLGIFLGALVGQGKLSESTKSRAYL